jgi:hypothetical protein
MAITGKKFSSLTAQQKADMRDAIRGYKVYTALLTQSNFSTTAGILEVGKTYMINSILSSDDFANVGYVGEGSPFVATETTPTKWDNNTEVFNCTDSAPIMTILENTIGSIVWRCEGAGTSFANLTEAFTENKTILFTDLHNIFVWVDINNIMVLNMAFNNSDHIPIEIRVYP